MKRTRRNSTSAASIPWCVWLVGLTALTSAPANGQSSLDQIHFRWRNDNGNEATATFSAAEDTRLSGVAKNVVQRLRLEVSNEGLSSSGPTAFQLQFAQTNVCSAGAPSLGAKTLAAGAAHTCVRLDSGAVQCWGRNIEGQLGDGNSPTGSSTAVPVTGITNADSVTAGEYHSCASFPDGSVQCWGENFFGELGDATTTPHDTPGPVSGVTPTSQVMAGSYDTCVRLASGAMKCTGYNNHGELGDNTTLDRTTPVSVSGMTDAIQATTGHYHTCALRQTGAVECWGMNSEGQVGDGNKPNDALVPTTVSGLVNPVEVTAGGYHTCARSASGTVSCWGDNSAGQLGNGNQPNDSTTPTAVPGLSGVVQLALGRYHTCALLASGSVKCWGDGAFGQLGQGAFSGSPTPVTVSGITNAVEVAAGHYHTCAILATGDIACWGQNGDGELGNNSTTDRNTPAIWTPSSAPTQPPTYAPVPTGATGPWKIVDSTYFTDGDPTSDISPGLTNEATTFVSGELKDAGNTTGSITLAADAFTEIEFALVATTNAVNGANYCFRLYDATNAKKLDFYAAYAEASIVGPTNYRSIGTAASYTTGTLSATDGSPVVTGTGTSWRAANRGRGDRIQINGTDYTIYWVASDTELTLTTPVSGNYSGAYTISRQFPTLQGWENCISGAGGCTYFPVASGNLVLEDCREVGIAYKDSVFTDNLDISGSTTDATHTITLTVDPGNRHTGIAGTGVVLTPAAANHAINVQTNFTTVQWLEIAGWTGNSSEAVHINADQTLYEYLLVHDGLADDADGFYIEPFSGNWSATVRNSIIYNVSRAGVHLQNHTGSPSNLTFNLENLTIYNCGGGTATFPGLHGGVSACRDTGGATVNAKNVLAVGNVDADGQGDGDFNTGQIAAANCNNPPSWGTSDFNFSSDASAPGATVFLSQPVGQFVSTTPTAEDLHLNGSSGAIDVGTSLSLATDIDLELRPQGAQWDIGADERLSGGACPATSAPWYDTSWQSRKALVVNSTKVSGPLTSFPVLIKRTSDAELAAGAQSDGDDILFTAADGITKLSHEIEKYVSATGELVAWVKLPYLSSGADTTIYVYFGNGTVGSQQDVANVWDASFAGVWHLQQTGNGTAGEFKDSTGNANHGQGGGGTGSRVPSMTTAGQIGPAQTFSRASTQFISIPDSPSLQITGTLTLEAWTNSNAWLAGDYSTVIGRQFGTGSGDSYSLSSAPSAGASTTPYAWMSSGSVSGGTVNTGAWYHLAATISGTASVIYVNGVPTGSTGGLTINTDANPVILGGGENDATSTPQQIWDGRIDEARISTAVRSGAWIQTEYNNQFDPASFYTICGATTAVELTSFDAEGLDGAVELTWETASELDNLGFHLHRATSDTGPYTRVTANAIPGLGSSPVGARYRYRDEGLTNGVRYYYKLEDIEATGRTEMHGPASATPRAGASSSGADARDASEEDETALITYGDPSRTSLEISNRSRGGVTLTLETGGFYATPQEDGSVRLEIPGFDALSAPDAPGLPIRRTWLEAIAGRKVEIVSVREEGVETFTGFRPADAETPEIVAKRDATVRAARRRRGRSFEAQGSLGLYPSEAARIASVGFQEEIKKALVELAPLRWDGSRGELRLTRRLVVRVSFQGREPLEQSTDGVHGRRSRTSSAPVATSTPVVRFETREKGLYAVRYEEISSNRRGVDAGTIRLSRQGRSVAFHLEPRTTRFGPGSTLYFLSDGADVNPYGNEAVYELEWGTAGEEMVVLDSPPSGEVAPYFWKDLVVEENHLYQAGLVDAADPWLWDVLFAPEAEDYPFEVRDLASTEGAPKLSVWLQGASDFDAHPDHHLRVYVNGSLVAESSWDGKRARRIDAELLPGLLREGDNTLAIENVGDTGAAYSMVLLDRFEVLYPRASVAEDGKLEGASHQPGTAALVGLGAGAHLLESTDTPRWLTGGRLGADGILRFGVEAGRRYLAVSDDALLRPKVTRVAPSTLKSPTNQADYLLIGPEDFLPAARPLVDLRRSEGLTVKAVSIEEIESAFGFGESSPGALQEFLGYAYHHWQAPSPRYVVLLGDATYDFKDYLGTGVTNRVPPRMVRTTYLWTASDPTYAAVNGDDLLPDLAIGRLPAASVEEVRAMVEKIVDYEASGAPLEGPTVLVADDADRAGDFESDADELVSSVLAPREPEKIYLRLLGRDRTREAIRAAFEDGAALVSYLGHGGIHLWASEDVWNIGDVDSLTPQSRQPILLTMNCLNGYYHFPYFNALSEELVKAESKGAIAAFSPSGLSLNAPAQKYHRALLAEILYGNHDRLGDAILAAQAVYADSGAFPELLSIYQLLGDPALKIR